MRFSPSKLKLWQDCQLEAKYHYIDKEPSQQGAAATWGTCLHHGLWRFNEGDSVEQAVDAFRAAWEEPESIDRSIDYWERNNEYRKMLAEGERILRQLLVRYDEWTDRSVIAAERKFVVPFGRHELEGIVDVIEVAKTGRGKRVLKIGDYKSGKNQYKPYRSNLRLDLAFTIYWYATLQPEFWMGYESKAEGQRELAVPPMPNGKAIWEAVQDMPRRVVWIQLRQGGKEYDAGPREDVDFMRLYRLCNQVEDAIEKGVFVPHVSGDTCGLCPYAETLCPMDIPSREEMGTEFEEDEDKWL